MTALYKEGRNQETCKMIRDHKDHIPAGWTSQQTEVWSFYC